MLDGSPEPHGERLFNPTRPAPTIPDQIDPQRYAVHPSAGRWLFMQAFKAILPLRRYNDPVKPLVTRSRGVRRKEVRSDFATRGARLKGIFAGRGHGSPPELCADKSVKVHIDALFWPYRDKQTSSTAKTAGYSSGLKPWRTVGRSSAMVGWMWTAREMTV